MKIRNRSIRGILAGLCLGLAAVLLSAVPGRAQSVRPGWGATPYATETETGVTFRVWAPNASSVQVGGDFSGWEGLEPSLQPEGTSGVWSADYPGISAGAAYKYKLNDRVWKSDPRARCVDQSEYGNARVPKSRSAADEPVFCLVPEEERVIYELHPGTFVDPDPDDDRCGTLWDAVGGLDHLEDLGINTIELMPVCEFTSDRSWGYNGAWPFAVEEDYGGPEALKAFVGAAHGRGMMVLLDVVYNHWDADGVLWQFDGWAPSAEFGGIYSYSSNGYCCTPWGPRPDYSRPEVREYIFDNLRMWKEEYAIDGFRWDAPRFIARTEPDNPEDSIDLPEGESLMREAVAMLEDEWPGTVNMAEDLGDTDFFDQHWAVDMPEQLGGILENAESGADLDAVAGLLSGSARRVVYSESHDTTGDLNGGRRIPVRMDPEDPASLVARRKSMLAAALVFAMPGTPLILQGQEWLEARSFSDAAPLDWDGADEEMPRAVESFYHDLIRLRRNRDGVSAGLQGSFSEVFWMDEAAGVLAWRRGTDALFSNEVVVVANLSGETHSGLLVPFPSAGDRATIFNSDCSAYSPDFTGVGPGGLVVRGTSAALDLAPWSCLMFSQAVDEDRDQLPDWWELEQAGDLDRMDAVSDSDDDGQTDLQEKAAGTDPLDGTSRLQCLQDDETLTWNAVAGREYDIEVCADLTEGFRSWTRCVAVQTGPLAFPLDEAEPGIRFFRIRLR